MKTLDKVIEELQYWDTYDEYPESFYDFEVVRDALHYLREYRKLDSLDAVAFQEDDNPALSWEELKTMEGKPVWVESQRFGNHWYLNRGIKDESCLYFVGHYGENVLLYDDDMGTLWQAYRKERE